MLLLLIQFDKREIPESFSEFETALDTSALAIIVLKPHSSKRFDIDDIPNVCASFTGLMNPKTALLGKKSIIRAVLVIQY
jgi:hypothetical protein